MRGNWDLLVPAVEVVGQDRLLLVPAARADTPAEVVAAVRLL
jgi:hypothetical protein